MSADKEQSENAGAIASIGDFLNHAYVIEREAQERYQDLAYQMSVHNNDTVARLFYKLAKIEGDHADEIKERLIDYDIPERAPWDFAWTTFESPEAADPQDLHYMMTPHHALQIALKAEERAFAFFREQAEIAESDDIRRLAEEFAQEEQDHVRWVKEEIARTPAPEPNWDEDWDPPNIAE